MSTLVPYRWKPAAHGSANLLDALGCCFGNVEDSEIADQICRTLNAHDALVAALSAVVRDSTRLEWEKNAPATYEMGESIYQAARAALALARKATV